MDVLLFLFLFTHGAFQTSGQALVRYLKETTMKCLVLFCRSRLDQFICKTLV